MRFTRIALCCLLFTALTACAANRMATDEKAKGLTLEDLSGRAYYLVSMNGKNFEGTNTPELSFTEEGRVTGRVCNRFSGTAKIVKGTLTAKNAVSTRMACLQPLLNELEQTLFSMLENGAQASLEGRQLTLVRNGHMLVYALPSPKP